MLPSGARMPLRALRKAALRLAAACLDRLYAEGLRTGGFT
jgi:hypothetical protein